MYCIYFQNAIELFNYEILLAPKWYIYLFSLLYRLKLECEKLAQEKTEMQRHYVMVSIVQQEIMEYGNNEFFSVIFITTTKMRG